MKTDFVKFKNYMSAPLPQKCCIEILFVLENSEKYNHCWMGAMNKNGVTQYWFGLTKDGKEAYKFNDFDEMASSPVFDGKTLKEIWGDVNILSVNSCDPEIMIN